MGGVGKHTVFPPQEAELYRYEVLDTAPEKTLDDLVHLAAYLCQAPIAVISLVDLDRQWFKSKIGLTETQTSRLIAFCAHTILRDELFVVSDALADRRFADNPLVTGDPHIRFYCGAPLTTPDGYRIGTLGIFDRIPRELSQEQLEAIRVLSHQVMGRLNLDRRHKELLTAVGERLKAEQALLTSQTKFQQLSDCTSSGIYIYSGERFLYANPAAEAITGFSLEELQALSLWDLVHPDFHEVFKDHARAVEAGDQAPTRLEFPIIAKDGQIRWLDFTVGSIEFEGQRARIGTAIDITDRKQTERSLRLSEERFRLVAEVTNDVLRDWDLTTDSHWWSPNARGKFGYDPNQEPSIAAWRSRLHPHDRKRVLGHVDDCLKSKERTFFDEYKFLLADGSYGVFWDKGRVVYDAEGKAVRMISTMIDITAIKRAYASLEQAYARLQQLSQELQRAEETERRRLSRELHDEFGQLLSALRLSLGRIQEELSKRARKKGSVLGKNVMAATKAADRLLVSLRELVHGLRPAVLDEFGLVVALQAMAEDIRQGTGIDCRLSVEPKNVHSMIGQELEGPLFRIAQELVTNVVRHAKATRADIRLRYADGMIALAVQDNGRGGRFAEPRKGYGLRGIHERTELLGGQVEIQSERRKGTIVTATFPVGPLSRDHGQIGSGRSTTIAKARKLPRGKNV